MKNRRDQYKKEFETKLNTKNNLKQMFASDNVKNINNRYAKIGGINTKRDAKNNSIQKENSKQIYK